MAAPEPLITSEELELRLSPPNYRKVFNDWGTSEVSQKAEEQMRADASSKVRGELANAYSMDELVSTNESIGSELRRITLDVAHGMCAIRAPRIFPDVDGFSMIEQAEKELSKIRDGKTSLSSNPEAEAGSGSDSGGSGGTAGDDSTLEPTVEECRILPGLGNFYG